MKSIACSSTRQFPNSDRVLFWAAARNRDIDVEKSPPACKLDLSKLEAEELRTLSEWSQWTACSRKCELGTTERSRSIIKEGSGGLGPGLALKEAGGPPGVPGPE
eukprot:Skav224804  [mRNA]  locus=scaffold764:681613:683151:- [translate_table: standard]